MIRGKQWGAASDVQPNPIDASAAASNTEIISINNSIAGQMPSGDIRNNYFMLGCTWTEEGDAPSVPFPVGNEVGTSFLANSTMETFQQGASSTGGSKTAMNGTNCFNCHTTNTTTVSHVYPALQPLTSVQLESGK